MKKKKSAGKTVIIAIMIIIFLVSSAILAFCFLPARYLPGYEGRIQIASVGIDVMLMEPPFLSDSTQLGRMYNSFITQQVVHKNNCAAQYWQDAGGVILENQANGSVVIADHSSQNFATLKDCTVGDIATIVRADGTIEEYSVTQNFIGINARDDLEYEYGGSALKDNPGGIIVYTCADETQVPVYIIFLQPRDLSTK